MEILQLIYSTVGFGLLPKGRISGVRILILMLFSQNVFNEICKETIGTVDFTLLRDRLILGPGSCGALMFFFYVFVERTCSMIFARRL